MPFTGGPSVRVSPNTTVEIRWIANFTGDGQVDVYDNPDGTGTPIDTKVSVAPSTEHRIVFNVGGVIQADTTYFFKVTHRDPNNNIQQLTNEPAPFPPFHTGAQQVTNLRSVPTETTAEVSWDANVIGTGKVEWGTLAFDQSLVDNQNIQNHAFTLANLQPDTQYQLRVSNNHAIDGDGLAQSVSSFKTQATTQPPGPDPTTTNFNLVQPHAEPRTVDPGQVSTLSVQAQEQGTAVVGVVVSFAIDANSQGTGALSSATATTNANGIASVQFTAASRGNVHVTASSPNARQSHQITVVVKRT